jgi:peptidoglycan/LPS O-acetylase OafA/YrhL
MDAAPTPADHRLALPARADIRQLTGLRGLAALDVVLSHYNEEKVPFLRVLEIHNQAVDLFFCLSAFTLCITYGVGTGRKIGWHDFAVARIARVYPLYLAVLLIAALYNFKLGFVEFSQYTRATAAADFLRQLVLINAWPIVGTGVHWMDAAWSVSIEAFCYVALFPLACLASSQVAKLPTRWLLAAMVMLAALSCWDFNRFFNPEIHLYHLPPLPGIGLHWVAIIRGATMFTAGWLAYLVWLRRDGAAAAAGIATDALCLAFALIVYGQTKGLVSATTVVLLMPFIVLGLMDGQSLTARLLASRPLHVLGILSYSIYMTHRPVALLLLHYEPWMRQSNLTRIGLPLCATALVSTLSFFAFEAPCRAAIRRLFGRRLAVRAATVI